MDRAPGTPGPAVDCHAHFLPAGAWSEPGAALPAALFDLDLQIEQMDALGIGTRVVAPPPFALQETAQDGDGHARLNDAMADKLRAAPRGRFLALGTVPLQWPDDAARELTRLMREMGFVGVTIGSGTAERPLDAQELGPFWAEAERLHALILLHPSRVPGAERMAAYHLRNLVGNPTVTSLAAAQLIFSGVLDRWPRLHIILSHGGGALPWIADRMDHGYAVRRECQSTSHEHPSRYLSRFYYDTIVFSDAMRQALVARVGPGRMVYGTDAPFDMSDTAGQAFADADLDDLLPALGATRSHT